jgi:hypothetical protein
MGRNMNAYRFSVGKPEAKTTVAKRRHGWEVIIKIDPRKMEWGAMEWIYLAQDRDPWRAICDDDNEASNSIKYCASSQ